MSLASRKIFLICSREYNCIKAKRLNHFLLPPSRENGLNALGVHFSIIFLLRNMTFRLPTNHSATSSTSKEMKPGKLNPGRLQSVLPCRRRNEIVTHFFSFFIFIYSLKSGKEMLETAQSASLSLALK